jgi:hypothetical protein
MAQTHCANTSAELTTNEVTPCHATDHALTLRVSTCLLRPSQLFMQCNAALPLNRYLQNPLPVYIHSISKSVAQTLLQPITVWDSKTTQYDTVLGGPHTGTQSG